MELNIAKSHLKNSNMQTFISKKINGLGNLDLSDFTVSTLLNLTVKTLHSEAYEQRENVQCVYYLHFPTF